MANSIEIDIVLNDGSIVKGLMKAESTAKKAGQEIGQSFSDGFEKPLAGMGKVITGALASIAATIGSALALKKIVDAAVEAENAVNDFNAALRVAGNFSVGASASFQEYASSLQRVTTVSDDAILQNASLLASLGKLQGEGLEKATKAALDLSAGMNLDLNTAFTAVAKAASGNTDALSRYGIKVSQSIPENERFAAVLDRVSSSFGGLSESKVNTFSGAMSQLSNVFNDFMEILGGFITSSPVIRDSIKFISSEILRVTEILQGIAKGGNPVDGFVKSLVSVGLAISEFVLPPLELLFNGIVFTFSALKGAIQEFLVVPLSAVGMLIGNIGGALGIMSQDTVNALNTFNQSAQEQLAAFNQKTVEAGQTMFDFDFSEGANSFLERLKLVTESASGIIQTIPNAAAGATKQTTDSFNKMVADIDATVKRGLVNVISAGMQAIGGALAKGSGAFDNFGKTILGILGDLAIQIGTLILLQGIAIASLQAALLSLNGPLAIAAGLALIALGGAMKALAGGGGAPSQIPAPTPVTTGGGVATSPGEETSIGGEAEKPGTAVVVNIQGNVLDRRQTGLEIAEAINEAFGQNGVVLAGANLA